MRRLQIALAFLLIPLSMAPYGHHVGSIATFALSHALIPAILVLVFGILYGVVGQHFNLAGLFWHDRLRTRFGAATGVTLLLALHGVFAFYTVGPMDAPMSGPAPELVDSMLATVAPHFFQLPSTDGIDRLTRFLLVACPPFLVLLMAPALLPAAFPRVPKSAPECMIVSDRIGPTRGSTMSVSTNLAAWFVGMGTWFLGICLGLLIVLLLLSFSRFVGAGITAIFGESLSPSRRSLIVLSFVLGFFYGILFLPFVYENVVSAAFAICAALGLVASVYELAYLAIDGMGAPVPGSMAMVGVAGALWFGLVNYDPYKLRLPGLEAYYPGGTLGPVPLDKAIAATLASDANSSSPALISDTVALENWLEYVKSSLASGGPKPKLAILAFSGGALRSGLWVSIVADRLEQLIPGFGRHVRLITGASGGMVGAGYYLVHRRALIDQAETAKTLGPYQPSEWVLSIPRDGIDPVARFLALRDPVLSMLPRMTNDDRGIRLENVWSELAFPIRDLMAEELAGKIPSMVLAPMTIEDGRRLLISNIDLHHLVASNGGAMDSSDTGEAIHPYSLSALEFFRIFPEALKLRLNTAIRMNASYPFITPAVNLPTDPPHRIFDAGFWDDYGIELATAWLNTNFDWLTANTSGVVLVQVPDSISIDARLGLGESPPSLWNSMTSGFRFYTSALEAMSSASSSSTIFRNDANVAALSDRFTEATGDRAFFTSVVFETSAEVSFHPLDSNAWPGDSPPDNDSSIDVALDWYLTRAERDGLFAAIPTPAPGSKWTDRANRLARIAELSELADSATGSMRVGILKQLEQAENYERLIQLAEWWNRV